MQFPAERTPLAFSLRSLAAFPKHAAGNERLANSGAPRALRTPDSATTSTPDRLPDVRGGRVGGAARVQWGRVRQVRARPDRRTAALRSIGPSGAQNDEGKEESKIR